MVHECGFEEAVISCPSSAVALCIRRFSQRAAGSDLTYRWGWATTLG